jgi:hypothetical protein
MPADRFRLIALARLPLQVPMVIWAARVARGAAGTARTAGNARNAQVRPREGKS